MKRSRHRPRNDGPRNRVFAGGIFNCCDFLMRTSYWKKNKNLSCCMDGCQKGGRQSMIHAKGMEIKIRPGIGCRVNDLVSSVLKSWKISSSSWGGLHETFPWGNKLWKNCCKWNGFIALLVFTVELAETHTLTSSVIKWEHFPKLIGNKGQKNSDGEWHLQNSFLYVLCPLRETF